MKTCSQTVKACGFKSVEQVAHLNGVTRKTVHLDYTDNKDRFMQRLYLAADALSGRHRALIGSNV